MDVFIVTSGDYSDYGIEAVFSTEALAKEYVAQSNGADIETWHVDEQRDARKVMVFNCYLREDGDLLTKYESLEMATGEFTEASKTLNNNFVGRSSVSYDHALKLAAEFRQSHLRETRP